MQFREVTRRQALLIASGAVLAAVAPSALGQSPPPGLQRVLDDFADRTLRTTPPFKSAPPGVSAALVLADGTTLTSTRGWADPKRRIPVQPATRFMSGSTGKTFCAATALRLMEQGVLTLDRPLAPLFRAEPWFERLPNASRLTLRSLLMHAAGFPQFLDEADFQATFLWDSLRGHDVDYSPRRMLSFILDQPPVAAFGTEHHYSDLHYDLVGLAIEKVTGLGYYAAMQQLVLTRLGGSDVLPAIRRDIPLLAAGYARGDLLAAFAGTTGRMTDDRGVLRKSPALEFAGGGLAVTPRALARFYADLAQGRIVSPATVAEMQRSSLVVVQRPGVTSRYGLGIFVTEREGLGRYLSHSGYFPGYNSNVAWFLDHGFAAAVQINTDHGPDINDTLRDLAHAVVSPGVLRTV